MATAETEDLYSRIARLAEVDRATVKRVLIASGYSGPVEDRDRLMVARDAVLQFMHEHDNWPRPDEAGDELRDMAEAIAERVLRAPVGASRSFQERVHAWVVDFFPEHGVNVPERARRFIEEATELVQAVGLPDLDIMRNVSRVLQRPAGQPHQEVGGTRVSLAALCAAVGLDERLEGERELERISAPGMRERMRAKQAQKVAEGVGE